MSYEITWQSIFDEFVSSHTYLQDKIVDWYPSGQLEITVKLSDGGKIAYDYIDKCIRAIRGVENDAELTEESCRLEFAQKLTRRMRLTGISQKELADQPGISSRMLGRYMSGASMPSLYNAVAIANALNCSLSEFSNS